MLIEVVSRELNLFKRIEGVLRELKSPEQLVIPN